MNVVITIREGVEKKYQGRKINETFRTNSIRTNSFLVGRTFQKIRKHKAIYKLALVFSKITKREELLMRPPLHVPRSKMNFSAERMKHNGKRSGTR